VQDRPALRVSAAAPGAELHTPPGDLERQLRRVALTLAVPPRGGGLTGEGREELHGIQAVPLRQAFAEATDDERRAAVTTPVRASVPRRACWSCTSTTWTGGAGNDRPDPTRGIVWRSTHAGAVADAEPSG
jgi:hypothetical protein